MGDFLKPSVSGALAKSMRAEIQEELDWTMDLYGCGDELEESMYFFNVARFGADSISPMYFNGVRFFIGGLSLIPVILLFEKGADDKGKKKTTLWAGILAGIVLAVASFLQQVGVELTDSAGKSGFITGLYMILVPIIGLFFGAKSKAKTWIGAILGILGLFMICMNGTKMTFTAGDLFLIADAVMFAFHIIIIR